MNESIIKTEKLCFSYDNGESDAKKIPALTDVSLEIKRGEYVAVLGHKNNK